MRPEPGDDGNRAYGGGGGFLELNDEHSNIVHETLERQIQLYIQYRQISTEEGVFGLIEHIKKTSLRAKENRPSWRSLF